MISQSWVIASCKVELSVHHVKGAALRLERLACVTPREVRPGAEHDAILEEGVLLGQVSMQSKLIPNATAGAYLYLFCLYSFGTSHCKVFKARDYAQYAKE